ncbi:MAG: hypothetical protein GXO47_03345, partial [Chlorobi bacterium]|nr:hypothetical protein [Chlorobiota bacterium]
TAEKCNEVWKKLELKAKSIKRHKKKIFTFSDRYNGDLMLKQKGTYILGCMDNCEVELFKSFIK